MAQEALVVAEALRTAWNSSAEEPAASEKANRNYLMVALVEVLTPYRSWVAAEERPRALHN